MPDNNRNISPKDTRRPRRNTGWYILLPFLAAALVQNLVAVFASQILVVDQAIHFEGGSYADFIRSSFERMQGQAFTSLTLLVYAFICVIWFGIWYRREFLQTQKPARDYRCLVRQYKHWSWMLIPGILLFILGTQYLSTYIMNTLAALVPQWMAEYQGILRSSGLDNIQASVSVILYVVCLGPACEELCFRGLTMSYARRVGGFWMANILQALLFGFFHMNMLQGSIAFLLGLALGYVKEKSQNLTLVILLHMAFNATSAFIPGLVISADNPVSYFVCLFGGLIAAYAGLELLVRGSSPRIVEVE